MSLYCSILLSDLQLQTVQLPRTQSVHFRYPRSCLRSKQVSRPIFWGAKQWTIVVLERNLHSLGASGVFLIFRLCGRKKEFPTLLQLRKILLRTVSCTGVLPFVVNYQKVQCSTADWRWYFIFATVYLIGFCFRGTLHSVFYQFVNCFLTGIASLNITAHYASHRKGTQIRFLWCFQNRFSKMETVCKGFVASCHEYPWSSRFTCRSEDYHAQWGFSGRWSLGFNGATAIHWTVQFTKKNYDFKGTKRTLLRQKNMDAYCLIEGTR